MMNDREYFLDRSFRRNRASVSSTWSGRWMMMRAYYMMFENKEGWKLALWFSVILNVNLALLNMLADPVLTAAHNARIIEGIRRRR